MENPRLEFQRLQDALWRDEKRNVMICADVLRAVREGLSPLGLTERTEHLELLAGRLAGEVAHLMPLRGGMVTQILREALDRLGKQDVQPFVAYASRQAASEIASGTKLGNRYCPPALFDRLPRWKRRASPDEKPPV
jgi:hypothetical protein